MDLDSERLFQPPLRDHEAAVLENAVRLAVDSVINVLISVNGARSHEYRRVVEDRDREIQRLEARLVVLERELRLLRRQGCSCGLDEARSPGKRSGGCGDPYTPAGQQECEMRISLDLFGGAPSSLVSPHSLESTLPPSPGRPLLDQSSGASGGADAYSGVVKEEACDIDTGFVKWEMSEERTSGLRGEDARSPSPTPGGGTKKWRCAASTSLGGLSGPVCPAEAIESRHVSRIREKLHPDPGGEPVPDGGHLRNKKRSVPMSQLPEEAQRIKRAAWRAASRRYYARKVARQQVNPEQPGTLPRLTNCPFSQPGPLPPDAWAASSSKFYSQGEEPPYGLMPEGDTPPGDTKDGHVGGIMCS